jgi:Protein of unknown function (DUF2786)
MDATKAPEHTAVDAGLISKVRKLLTMAEGTANPNEADAFSRKAAELIAAHRIDPDRLGEHRDDRLTVRKVAVGRGAYVRARIALLQSIAEAHGCRVVFQAGPTGTIAFVAGFESDLETTEMLYASLHAQASARMGREQRATGAATQRWRRSFLFGYAAEVGRMLEGTQHEAARAAAAAGVVDVLPVLVDRERRVADFARTSFGRVTTARPASAAIASGWHAGKAAAAAADVGRRAIPGRRALGPGS